MAGISRAFQGARMRNTFLQIFHDLHHAFRTSELNTLYTMHFFERRHPVLFAAFTSQLSDCSIVQQL